MRPCRLCSRWAIHRDHVHLQADEFGSKFTQTIIDTRRVPLLDDNVLALEVAMRVQAAAKRIEFLFIRTSCAHKSNAGDLGWLLRARSERPRRCCPREG